MTTNFPKEVISAKAKPYLTDAPKDLEYGMNRLRTGTGGRIKHQPAAEKGGVEE